MLGYKLVKQRGEMYRMGIDGEKFHLTMSRAFYDYLMVKSSLREDLRACIQKIRAALYTDVVTFEMTLPFIPRPNYGHRGIDWECLIMRSEQISLLLNLLNFTQEEVQDELRLSERPQLLAIQTAHIRRGDFANSPLELGLHPVAFGILAEECKSDTVVAAAEKVILDFYLGMSCQSLKERESRERDFRKYGGSFMGCCTAVRAGGTPHFIVPGNCACLGANPGEFKYEHSMYSHNVDSSLQQLSMLAGIITFWNDFLTPKWLAKHGGAVSPTA